MKDLSKKTKKRIVKELECLVQHRFTKETLEIRLKSIFGTETKVEDISSDDDELSDFNFLAEMKNDAIGLFGYVDIYFLKMRKDNMIYVTEVAYQFE